MMPPGLDAGGWATARAGPVHSSHASPLALSPASGHASLPLHALPERNLIGVAGELRTLIKVRISPGLAAASKTRQIDDASVCCASRHTCLSEDSPSQDMVPPACPDASSSMRGNGQGTHSFGHWLLAVILSSTVKLASRANDWLCASAKKALALGAGPRPTLAANLSRSGVVGWSPYSTDLLISADEWEGTASARAGRLAVGVCCYPTLPSLLLGGLHAPTAGQ